MDMLKEANAILGIENDGVIEDQVSTLLAQLKLGRQDAERE